MTALKNQFQKARVVLESLVQGLHPESGAELPKEDVVNNIEVNRAMSTAVMALDQMTARLTRRAILPDEVGKGWTEEEEQQLKDEFDRSEPLPPTKSPTASLRMLAKGISLSSQQGFVRAPGQIGKGRNGAAMSSS